MTHTQMRLPALLPSLALLCACASYSGSSLKPGISTEADTRTLMGAPFAVHLAGRGAGYVESWEYPHGPEGRQTYMVRFDAHGRVVRVDQVLRVGNLRRLTPGVSTRDNVRDLC